MITSIQIETLVVAMQMTTGIKRRTEINNNITALAVHLISKPE